MTNVKYVAYGYLVLSLVQTGEASGGDTSLMFGDCRHRCLKNNCTSDGVNIRQHAVAYYGQTLFDKLFLWSCLDECEHSCMWKTVEAIIDIGRPIPQFFGKWPFIRFLGMQEPASTLFSIANFISHMFGLKAFRTDVRPDSPFFKLWHVFALVNLNGWFWSAVFHTRDLPLTELLDYTFANSIILVMFYCMIIRLTNFRLFVWKFLISVIFIFYFITYFSSMAVKRIKYSFNMKINIAIGVVTALIWLGWCYHQRYKRPYTKLLVKFYFLFMLATALELVDFPPILWIFDSHALWHLSTVGLVPILYKFITEDCKALRSEKFRKEV